MTNSKTLVGQLRGATRLAVEATRHLTDVVESMHHTILSGPEMLGRPLEAVAKLVTAPGYGAARGVTALVGTGLDAAFAQLETVLHQTGADSGPLLAVLNGVVGDHLATTGNPLAIEMQLCARGERLELTPAALSAAFPEGSRLLIMQTYSGRTLRAKTQLSARIHCHSLLDRRRTRLTTLLSAETPAEHWLVEVTTL